MDGMCVRQRAGEATDLAEQVRAVANQAASARDAQWRSVAAAAFREVLDSDVYRVLAVAVAFDEVANALHAHARAVEVSGADAVLGLLPAARRALDLLP